MNLLLIQRSVSGMALGADATGDVMGPSNAAGWADFAVKNWGLAGLALGLFVLATYRSAQWIAPILRTYIETRNALVQKMAETQQRNSERLDRIELAQESIAKRLERMSGVIHRNCGKAEEPDSDLIKGETEKK